MITFDGTYNLSKVFNGSSHLKEANKNKFIALIPLAVHPDRGKEICKTFQKSISVFKSVSVKHGE